MALTKAEISRRYFEKKKGDPSFTAMRAEASRRYRANNPNYDTKHRNKTKQRDTDLRRTYGISLTDYERMLVAQNGVCAICRTTGTKRLAVDHCHKSGRVRGLLWFRCNMAIGYTHDDAARLRAAADYVERGGT